MTITPEQIRVARELLGWSPSMLAKRARRTVGTVNRAELATLHESLVDSVTISIRRALEAAGVEFVPENGGGASVRLRKT